jgi:hypothetical protein
MTGSRHALGRNGRGLVLICATAGTLPLLMTACSSSSTTPSPAAGSKSTAQSAERAGGATPMAEVSSSSAGSAGDGADAGSIDVCALLSAADATAIATKFTLASDPSATYRLTTEKLPAPTTSYPTSACRFTIAEVTADNTGSEAIVSVTVAPAKYLDKTGTKVDGLGDEAYDEGNYVQVRTGDVVLQSNENSGASQDFINAMYQAMYQAMIPNVR